jgi:Wzt C-terminal domain
VATVEQAWIEVDGREAEAVAHGAPYDLHGVLDVHEAVPAAEFHVQLTNDDGLKVFGTKTAPESLAAGERVHVRVRMANPLGPGRYYVDIGIHQAGGGMLAYRGRARDFLVHGGPEEGGLVAIDHEVELERDQPRARTEAPR